MGNGWHMPRGFALPVGSLGAGHAFEIVEMPLVMCALSNTYSPHKDYRLDFVRAPMPLYGFEVIEINVKERRLYVTIDNGPVFELYPGDTIVQRNNFVATLVDIGLPAAVKYANQYNTQRGVWNYDA